MFIYNAKQFQQARLEKRLRQEADRFTATRIAGLDARLHDMIKLSVERAFKMIYRSDVQGKE
jgi:hypothetical protein